MPGERPRPKHGLQHSKGLGYDMHESRGHGIGDVSLTPFADADAYYGEKKKVTKTTSTDPNYLNV